ncbi:hypothetical protein Fmac_011931 [Flemingia macrophylla]|uniref:Uncharacterized protein n=1 Tax=Flemingia macrophylla TaxID=520843 RepID=A0ABD1MNU1_9FABA
MHFKYSFCFEIVHAKQIIVRPQNQPHQVKEIQLRRDHIMVVLIHKILIHNFPDMKSQRKEHETKTGVEVLHCEPHSSPLHISNGGNYDDHEISWE